VAAAAARHGGPADCAESDACEHVTSIMLPSLALSVRATFEPEPRFCGGWGAVMCCVKKFQGFE
jgi:hypothetical protein